MSDKVTGGAAAIAALEAAGVEVVFGIPGVHTLALYDALHDRGIRHVLARHEQGAGFMADGYARATGKPGVALIITGPGITNVATAGRRGLHRFVAGLLISSQVERLGRQDVRQPPRHQRPVRPDERRHQTLDAGRRVRQDCRDRLRRGPRGD